MDPLQTLLDAREAIRLGDLDTARELALAYRDWRRRGGFEPQGVPMNGFTCPGDEAYRVDVAGYFRARGTPL